MNPAADFVLPQLPLIAYFNGYGIETIEGR
jgi:hypothetical protein